jgi:hypothetical protein
MAGWIFIALSTLCAAIYAGALTSQVFEYRRAAKFLEELKGIHPGQSEASVMPLIQHYQGVRDEDGHGVQGDSYTLRIDPWHLMHRFLGPNWLDRAYRETSSDLGSWRRAVKLSSWSVTGWVEFANGRVKTVSADVILEGENEWLQADWRYGPKIPPYVLVRSVDDLLRGEESQYKSDWMHLHFGDETGEGIRNFITPLSTAQQLTAAQNINLQCLMSGRGCRSLCDLMPDATQYRREHSMRGWGWNSGAWGKQSHDCQ